MQQCKVVSILGHPERYEFVKSDPVLIYDLIKKGVLMQANYGSILGQYGEKTKMMVTKLLENNMIHMLGSDVHREKTIYSKIPECLEKIENIIGKEKLEKLTTINPGLVLNNKRIDIEEPIEIEYTLKDKFDFLTGGKINRIFNKFITK
jgi:protein-tyrosine phosphatase